MREGDEEQVDGQEQQQNKEGLGELQREKNNESSAIQRSSRNSLSLSRG